MLSRRLLRKRKPIKIQLDHLALKMSKPKGMIKTMREWKKPSQRRHLKKSMMKRWSHFLIKCREKTKMRSSRKRPRLLRLLLINIK